MYTDDDAKISIFIASIRRDITICPNRKQEAVVRRCSIKKVVLEILQNSQESTCARVSFLIKLQLATLLKKRPWHKCFPSNFVKFLRTPFLTEHLPNKRQHFD